MLERLVGNLLENALRHNVAQGGWVRVESSTDDRGPVLRVVTSGEVLDPAMLPVLFEPFRRQGGERLSRHRGLGLGLSIVAAVVTAHGARLRAAARPEGDLDLEIRLPRQSSDARSRADDGRITSTRPPALGPRRSTSKSRSRAT